MDVTKMKVLADALRPFAKVGETFNAPDVPLLYLETDDSQNCFYISGESGDILTTTHLKNAARVLAEVESDEAPPVAAFDAYQYDFNGVAPDSPVNAWVIALMHYARQLELYIKSGCDFPENIHLDLYKIALEMDTVMESIGREQRRAFTSLGHPHLAENRHIMPDTGAMRIADEVEMMAQTLNDAFGESSTSLVRRLSKFIWAQKKAFQVVEAGYDRAREALRSGASMATAATQVHMDSHSEWKGVLRGLGAFLKTEESASPSAPLGDDLPF